MTFTDSIRTCISKYATFSGRAPRSEYWWFVLFAYLVIIVASGVFYGIGYAVGGSEGGGIAAVIGYVLSLLLLFLPNLAVSIRRLHDTGRSGWWYLVILIPYIGGIWLLILFVQGSDDENQYGLPVY